MLEHPLAYSEGSHDWRQRQVVRTARKVVEENKEKKGSELAMLLKAAKVPIHLATTLFVGLGYLAIIQPTKEKGVRVLQVSDERISIPEEAKEKIRQYGMDTCRKHGPHGKPVSTILWDIT